MVQLVEHCQSSKLTYNKLADCMVSENKSLFRLLLYKATVILFYGLQNVCDPLLKIAPLNSKNVLNL